MDSAQSIPTVAVIGGGLSGLTAAYRLRRTLGAHVRIVVIEQAGQLGGKVRTEVLAGAPIDVGAEAFITRRPEASNLVNELGLASQLQFPQLIAATIHAGGRTAPLPKRTFLGIPTEVKSVTQVLSSAGCAALVAESSLSPLKLSGDISVGKIVTERLGKEVLDRLVDPLLGGVYAGKAEDLSLRATMPALAAILDQGVGSLQAAAQQLVGPVTENQPSEPVFGTLTGGLVQLIDALVAQSDVEVHCNATVRKLSHSHGFWRIERHSLGDSHSLSADAVVLAVPPPAARKLLMTVAPNAAASYAQIPMSSMAVIALALPTTVALPAASGTLIAQGERRADGIPFTAKAFTYSSQKWGQLADSSVMVRASVGRFGEVAALQQSDDELIAAIRADLAELTGITAAPHDAIVQRWGGGLPQYIVGHNEIVAEIEKEISTIPGLAIAGAALHGVGLPACIATGETAAERIVAYLKSADRITNATINPWPG